MDLLTIFFWFVDNLFLICWQDFLDLLMKFFGFVDEIFWICWQFILDLSTKIVKIQFTFYLCDFWFIKSIFFLNFLFFKLCFLWFFCFIDILLRGGLTLTFQYFVGFNLVTLGYIHRRRRQHLRFEKVTSFHLWQFFWISSFLTWSQISFHFGEIFSVIIYLTILKYLSLWCQNNFCADLKFFFPLWGKLLNLVYVVCMWCGTHM